MRPHFEWNIGSRALPLGRRTLVMGVVNVTPDSFSDGGMHFAHDRALERCLQLLREGADIVDIGGESTRPGTTVASPSSPASSRAAPEGRTLPDAPPSPSVSEAEELARVIPVITSLAAMRLGAIISIDTYKSRVARAAVEAGAEIVNDVSGFLWDPEMAAAIATLNCGAVLVHTRGKPDEWSQLAAAEDIVVEVKRELRERAERALAAGIRRERIVLDPGFGFGKRLEQNYPLLKRLEEFHQLRYPLLAGVSRKSFLGRALARGGTDAGLAERSSATLAAETAAILKGAHVIRTHDARACADAARIADMVVG